jgi:hypothetical protein
MRGGRRHSRGPASGLQFPTARSTGATATAVTTVNVPSGATSGTGWSWTGSACVVTASASGLNVAGPIIVTGAGATLSNCIADPASSGITISASGVTVDTCTAPSALMNTGGLTGILIRQCTLQSVGEPVEMNVPTGAGVDGLTIQDCTISGLDAGPNRTPFCVDDNRGNTTNLLVQRCNIYWCRDAFNISNGTLLDNYVHDFGYVANDHSDGVANGGTGGVPLTIVHNAILMSQPETAPLILGGPDANLQNVTIQGNLLAGGDYCIYGGLQGSPPDDLRTDTGCSISGGTTLTDASLSASDAGATVTGTGIPPFTTIGTPSGSTATLSQACTNGSGLSVLFHLSTITVLNNRFSQMFYPLGGTFGVVTDLDNAVAANVWAGNVYHDTGIPV